MIKKIEIDLEGSHYRNPYGNKVWCDNYVIYLSFLSENHRRPKQSEESERKLYTWVASQKRRLKLGNLTEQQKQMLEKAGIR